MKLPVWHLKVTMIGVAAEYSRPPCRPHRFASMQCCPNLRICSNQTKRIYVNAIRKTDLKIPYLPATGRSVHVWLRLAKLTMNVEADNALLCTRQCHNLAHHHRNFGTVTDFSWLMELIDSHIYFADETHKHR